MNEAPSDLLSRNALALRRVVCSAIMGALASHTLAGQASPPLAAQRANALVEQIVRVHFRLGDASGTPLTNPTSVQLGNNGGVLVADAADHAILKTDAAGKVVQRFGGRGEGPGQFLGSNLRAAALDGDSVIGIDALGRLNLYGAGGRAALSKRLFPDKIPPLFSFHGAFGGRLVTSHRVRSDTLSQQVRDARAGTTTLVTRVHSVFVERAHDGRIRFQSPPLALEPVVLQIATATNSSGKTSARSRQLFPENVQFTRPVLVADNGGETVVYRALASEWHIVASNTRGRTLSVISLPPEWRPSPRMRSSTTNVVEVTTIGLFADSRGRVWIQDPRPVAGQAHSEWWVVSPSGRLHGIVHLPSGLLPVDANDLFVAALREDAEGTVEVVVLRRDLAGK